MSRHTPGPWHYSDGQDVYTHQVRDADNRLLGSCSQGTRPELEANARLMAAAPELLEAAKLLEEADQKWANCPDCESMLPGELCESCFPLYDAARLKRRAAIAKAEGKS